VLGRQERTLGLLSVSAQQVQQVPQVQQPQYQQPPPVGQQPPQQFSTVTRQDIDTLVMNQQVISNSLRDLSTVLNDVSQRTTQMANRGTATVQSGPTYETQQITQEMRDGLNHLKQQMAAIVGGGGGAQAAGQIGCPKTSCLGMTPFLIVIAVQLIITLGYSIYRDNKEQQAKKFY